MTRTVNRRTFAKRVLAGLGAAAAPVLRAAEPRNLKIGYTTLIWGAVPRSPENLEPGVKRDGYNFQEHRQTIVASLNEYAKAVTDLGLGTGLHQHTGTCVETRDAVYAVMEAANTTHLKFAPDVGQLQKGGADAAKVVKDFLPITVHMHLKDFVGGPHFAGYCPLGQGKVDLKAILDMMESNPTAHVMVELDGSA